MKQKDRDSKLLREFAERFGYGYVENEVDGKLEPIVMDGPYDEIMWVVKDGIAYCDSVHTLVVSRANVRGWIRSGEEPFTSTHD